MNRGLLGRGRWTVEGWERGGVSREGLAKQLAWDEGQLFWNHLWNWRGRGGKMPGQWGFFSLIAINKIGKHWRFWGRRESLIMQHLILTSTEPRLNPLSIFTFPLMGWFLCYCLSMCWPTSSFWLWASVYLRTVLAKRIKRRNHFYMPDLRSTQRAQTFSPAGLLSAFPESIIKICSERFKLFH